MSEKQGVAVRAGSSGGQVICGAAGATALWYTFDDRLAEMSGVAQFGVIPLTMALGIALTLAILLAVAGMQWNSG